MLDLALLADDVESGWGTVIAAWILALLPIAFAAPLLYSVFLKAGAKGFSPRAVQSVGYWLISLSLLFGGAILALFGHYSPADVTSYRVSASLFGLASWSMAVVGTNFALRGLRETDKKHTSRRRGHTYAVGGCTGNVVLLMALMAGGGWYGRHLLKNTQADEAGGSYEAAAIFAEATRVAAEALKNAPSVPSFGGGSKSTTGGPDAAAPTLVGSGDSTNVGRAWFGTVFGSLPGDSSLDTGPATLDYVALNFRLQRPGDGWVRIDPARAGGNTIVAYDFPARKLRLIVAGRRPGVERSPTLDQVVAAAQNRLRAAGPTFDFTAGENLQVGGVEGRTFTGSGMKGSETCAVHAWLAVHNGFVYELLVAGSGEAPDAYRDEARRLFSLFAPLDAALVAHASEVAAPTAALTVKSTGLDVKPLDAAWTAMADLAVEYPEADYGARYDAQTGFIATAVRLDDAVVNPTAAAYALLTTAGQPYQQVVARAPKKVTQSKIAGEEFAWVPQGAAASYRMARIFVGKRTAYLLLGWCDEEGSPRYQALQAALAAVQFTTVDSTATTDLPQPTRTRSARFYGALGKYYAGQGVASSAEAQFRTALKLAPEEVTYLIDLFDACFARQRYSEALAALNERPDLINRHDSLRVRKAEALAAGGQRTEAIQVYAALFRDGYVDDDALRRYVALLERAGRWDDALSVVKGYRSRRNTPAMFALEARLLAGRGDNFAAATMLERHLAQTPTDAEPAFALADIYRRLQRPADAVQVIEKLVGGGGISAEAYYWKGLAQYDLRHTREARDSFEQAHRLDPADLRAKQMLDFVTRLLGEAENLRIRTPLEPVVLPSSVVDAVPTSPMPDEFGRAPAYYLDRVTAYRFLAGDDYRRTEYHSVRVLTTEGVDEFNTLTVDFDPLSEEVFVNRLDVFDDTGRPTAGGDVATYYLVDEAGTESAGRRRVLTLPVPGLRPGYRVELVATVHTFVNRTRFPYLQTYFGLKYPVRRQAVVIIADPAQLTWSGTQTDAVRREANGVWWQSIDLPALRREPFAPNPAETEPSLFVADKRSTWESESERFVAEIADLRTVPAIVERTAREMTVGMNDTEAKLLALSAFVQREIAYQPAPFGSSGRVAQTADKTLANRFGDGQDVSLLLAQMLATVGVDTRLALVNTQQPVQGKLATLDQFDHMVVFIPQGDSGRVIDATDKQADARLTVPLRLAGHEALIIDDRKPRLVRLPRPALNSYRAEVARHVKFDAAGVAQVRETITFHDYYAAAMRGRLRGVPLSERADFWQRLLREAGTPVVVQTFSVDKLDDLTAPLVVTAEYDVERALTSVGSESSRQWVGTVPAAFESTLLSAPATESRRQPLDFPFALRLSSTVDVEPPAGQTPAGEDGLSAQVDADLLTAQRTGSVGQGRVRVTFELTHPAGRHPAARYDDYRQALHQARSAASPQVRFTAPTGK